MADHCEMAFVVLYKGEIANKIPMDEAMVLLSEELAKGGTPESATAEIKKQLRLLMKLPA